MGSGSRNLQGSAGHRLTVDISEIGNDSRFGIRGIHLVIRPWGLTCEHSYEFAEVSHWTDSGGRRPLSLMK
jgi:hypothetical protein